MIDIRKKADEMGVVIVEKESIPNAKGASFRKNGIWHIMIDSTETEERKNFTIAHELAEIMLYDVEDLTIDEKHKKANFIAAEFLMPEEEFKKDVYNYDLYELKKIYNGCSYEVIARRMLKFKPIVLTIYDNKRKYLRISSDLISFPSVITDSEIKIVEECYNIKNKYEKFKDNLHISGYFVNDGRNVERVILLTEVLDI